MKQKMDILIVEPGKAPRPAALPDNTLEAVEAVLGGAAQVGCFLPQRVLLVSREDTGGLAPNRCMPGGAVYPLSLPCPSPPHRRPFPRYFRSR